MRPRRPAALALTSALAAVTACAGGGSGGDADGYITAEEAVAWEGLPWDARIAYGPDERHFGELRLPPGAGPHPVAVVLHGGCWMSLADHDYMDPVAAALTEAGWATWNLEFRAVDQEGGAWPGIFRDVAAGIDHLREVARDHPLDLERVVAVGHSSGGHLALWAAARARIPEGADLHAPGPLPLHAVVGLAAIADVEHYHGLGIGWDDGCGDAPVRLLGGHAPSDVPERLSQASPAALGPTGVPRLLLTGADDRAVPPEHGEAYVAGAVAGGEEAEHHVLPRSAHFEIVAPWTPAWQEAWALVGPFLDRIRASG